MSVMIRQIDADRFPLYDAVPNWFRVESELRVEVVDGAGGTDEELHTTTVENRPPVFDTSAPTVVLYHCRHRRRATSV